MDEEKFFGWNSCGRIFQAVGTASIKAYDYAFIIGDITHIWETLSSSVLV